MTAPEVKPLHRLLGWLMLVGSICLILSGTGYLLVPKAWLVGYWTCVGLVFLESLRVQIVHNTKGEPKQ